MTSPINQTNKGAIFILLSALMFGSYGVWSRLIGGTFGPFYQGWTRALIISLVIVPILLFKKQIIPIQKKDWKWLIVFLVFTSATQGPIFYAFNHMDIGTATLLFFVTMPLTMFVVGFLFLKENVTLVKTISFLLALLGLFFVFTFSIEKFTLFAALMAIVGGIASGGEVAFTKKLSNSYSALYISALSWLIIVPTNLIFSLVLGERQFMPTLNMVWMWQLIYSGVGFLGFWLVTTGVKYVEASIGGLIGLLEVVFSMSFGIIFFRETLSSRVVLGAVLILLAASIPNINDLLAEKHRKLI